jgi:predicted component of type VI protein secretion system
MDVRLVVCGGKHPGQEVPILVPRFLVGRAAECHLRPQSEQVSRRHCEIENGDGCVAVRDLGSRTGTFVNGQKIEGRCELKNGDRLKVGPLEFQVQLAVSVGGRKRPKVQSVEEAVSRTVQGAGRVEGPKELDIAAWIEEEPPRPAAPAPAATGGPHHSADKDTAAAGSKAQEQPGKKAESPGKPGGPLRPKKTLAPTTSEAADEIIRRYLRRKQ